MQRLKLAKFFPENRYWILAMILFSLVAPLQYAIHIYFPPDGLVFAGMGGDDSEFLTTMRSVEWGEKSPWIIEGTKDSIFINPAHGPIYLLLPLGYISYYLSVPYMASFLILKFISSLFFMLVLYNFMNYFFKKRVERDVAYAIFIFSAGLGGLFYLIFRLITDPSSLFSFFPLYGYGISFFNTAGTYQILPFATAIIAVFFFMERKYIKSSVFLFMTAVIYPVFSIGTIIGMMALFIVDNKRSIHALKVVPLYFLSLLIWIVPFLLDKTFFSVYAVEGAKITGIFLPTIIISLGLPFLFAVHWMSKDVKKNRIVLIVAGFLSVVLFSMSNLVTSYWTLNTPELHDIQPFLLTLVNVIKPYTFIFDVPLLALVLLSVWYFWSRRRVIGRYNAFMCLWLSLMLLVLFLPTVIISSLGAKIISFLWLPVSVIASLGIIDFSRRKAIELKLVVILIIAVSLPSLILSNILTQTSIRNPPQQIENCCYYYTGSEIGAMKYLNYMENGVVLSSVEIGTWLPFYSGQKTLFTIHNQNHVLNLDEKLSDYKKIYSGIASDEMMSLIKKYKIKYIFYSKYEKIVSGGALDLSSYDFLKNVYDSGDVQIFSVSN